MSKLDDLRARLATEVAAAKAISEKPEAEGRDPSGEELAEFKTAIDKANGTKALIERTVADNQMLDELSELVGTKGAPGTPVAAGKGRTIGEQFVKSAEYQAFIEQFPDGRIPEKARVQSAPVLVKTLLTGGSDTSGGVFVNPDVTGIYEPLGRQPLTIRNLVSVRQTTSDTVEYVRQTGRTNNAAPVPEATQTSGTSGTKPEGGFDFEKVTENVVTIAEWIPATKRALADVGQLMGLINQELRDDLAETEEEQIVNGDGSGENLTGILNTPGTLAQAFDTDAFVTTRKARTLVRIEGRSVPTAYVMNPADWEAIDLQRDGNDRFFGAGPFGMSTPTLWGLPVVESESIPEGTAVLADWRKAILWDRESATISVSDSHADFFVRNIVAVLGEQREAFGIIRPSAFVLVDLTSGGGGG